MIRMLAGIYGKREGNRVIPKDRNSGPFEDDPEQEAWLVRLGLAVYVDPPDGEKVKPVKGYGIANTAAELREIGKQRGLTFNIGMSKLDMIKVLDAHEESEPVDLDADPLAFDAAEAVQ